MKTSQISSQIVSLNAINLYFLASAALPQAPTGVDPAGGLPSQAPVLGVLRH